jgi:hypothetical protein
VVFQALPAPLGGELAEHAIRFVEADQHGQASLVIRI